MLQVTINIIILIVSIFVIFLTLVGRDNFSRQEIFYLTFLCAFLTLGTAWELLKLFF